MIVSWKWLHEYVRIELPREEIENRLTMSGLNHESTKSIDDDFAIDLEVTSNRPDCLGHIGIAREISVLTNQPLSVNDPQIAELTDQEVSISSLTQVNIESPEFCPRYTARLIRGVKIGPSPDWLVQRLAAIGIKSVNNVVDVTNFVMMECGQPLHAFDFDKLHGGITVRAAKDQEELVAIDHRTYQMDSSMCVIADDQRAIAIAGVMGGADTEVHQATTNLLIESADFSPLAVRYGARKLKLHSASSYRFERTVDPSGIDWASRRCCELIVQVAGGKIASDVIDAGNSVPLRNSILIRTAEIKRVLGIRIPVAEVSRILAALGNHIVETGKDSVEVVPPNWRRDLTREVDLIEEVARIHGYDKIPENAPVPMAATVLKDEDRATEKIRNVLVTANYFEAMTTTLVPKIWSDAFSPWSDRPPLVASQSMQGVVDIFWQNIGGADLARRSLLPSLLESRRVNEHRSNPDAQLFEIAKVYLSKGNKLPMESWKLALVSSQDFYGIKGLVESIARRLNPDNRIVVKDTAHELFDAAECCELTLNGKTLGWIGKVSASGKELFHLRADTTAGELDLATLIESAVLIPQQKLVSGFPAITRDFNFILDEPVRWDGLETTVRDAGGELIESVRYVETFRDSKKDGAGKKRVLLSVILRSDTETLTGVVADELCGRIIDHCKQKHQAVLVG
jgi:phenylalanyl-tRNA synthetase beta chain